MSKIGMRDDGYPKSCEICAQIEFQTNCYESPNKLPEPDFSKYTAAKHDTGKPRCDLVSPALIEGVGAVRGYGTDKYGSADNWQTVESSRFMAALIRHLCHCMRDLSSVDEESGLPHLWHVATNVNFLMERVEVRDDQD